MTQIGVANPPALHRGQNSQNQGKEGFGVEKPPFPTTPKKGHPLFLRLEILTHAQGRGVRKIGVKTTFCQEGRILWQQYRDRNGRRVSRYLWKASGSLSGVDLILLMTFRAQSQQTKQRSRVRNGLSSGWLSGPSVRALHCLLLPVHLYGFACLCLWIP